MTATLAGSSAALKILYPKGELPHVLHKKFPSLDKLAKKTDFVGESQYVALQNENPQGVSADFATAQGSIYQGTYNRFNLTRVEYFGVARIKGHAAEAAVKNEGALVDLWKNETEGVATTVLKMHQIQFYGNGSGALGDATFSTVTATLSSSSNMNYFDLGMRVGAVSDGTKSPTARVGYARVTGIDRVNRTLTTGSNWSAQIVGITNGDYLTRAGDASSGGTGVVLDGLQSYVVGGATPGTLFGLNRNTDPVRLSGQAYSAASVAMEDAVVEASALGGFQGVGYADTLLANNRDIANMKKSMAAKIIYDRGAKSEGGVSFSKIMIEGEAGPIEIIADPFCPRNKAFLLMWDAFDLHSLGAAPHLDNYDKNDFLRVASDDAMEVRFKSYLNLRCKNPAPHVLITSFGA